MDKYLYKLDEKEQISKSLVGGKGFYLNEMSQNNLPVPQACVITTDFFHLYQKDPKKGDEILQEKIIPEIVDYLKSHNKGEMPLVSVRSSGEVSMPGMMDTILNLGLNKDTIKSFIKDNTLKFALDCYKRFFSMYGEIVLKIDKDKFNKKKKFSTVSEVENYFSDIYKKHNQLLPEGKVEDQLHTAILSILNSWNNERAVLYRQLNNIDNNKGTAVVIQQMVFGNRNENSATGVLFSKDPSTGRSLINGEYLPCAQGEDVVSGSATPEDISQMDYMMPELYKQLKDIAETLEEKYNQVQDIEFTIDDGKLYILQARTAKCSPLANLTIAVNMQKAKKISAREVLDRISVQDYLSLNIKQISPTYSALPDGNGLPASTGAVCARVVFNAKQAEKYADPTVLLAKETTPDDLKAIEAADAILTTSGGVTSHAAVVARSMNKCCVVGCSDLKIDRENNRASLGSKSIKEGDFITLDGQSGRVWVGDKVPIVDSNKNDLLVKLEDLIFEAYPNLIRITEKVDDILENAQTWFATYDLDNKEDNFVRNELHDACKYLTGTMDLTGKLDFLQQKYGNNLISYVDDLAKETFIKKKDLLKGYIGKKSAFTLYLGSYYDEFHAELQKSGFKVKNNNDVVFDDFGTIGQSKKSKPSLESVQNKEVVLATYIKEIEQGKNYAIGAKNFLLSKPKI